MVFLVPSVGIPSDVVSPTARMTCISALDPSLPCLARKQLSVVVTLQAVMKARKHGVGRLRAKRDAVLATTSRSSGATSRRSIHAPQRRLHPEDGAHNQQAWFGGPSERYTVICLP